MMLKSWLAKLFHFAGQIGIFTMILVSNIGLNVSVFRSAAQFWPLGSVFHNSGLSERIRGGFDRKVYNLSVKF
jgi:hypothetical protein